jgi:AraC-like DNA-binding protein
MQSAVHVPSAPLSQYIECLWYHEIPDFQGRELILPSQYIELIFNFGNPHKVLDLNDFERFEWQRESWLAGMQTRCIAIESTSSHMIGARFKPGGAYAFFPKSINAYTDKVMPVEQIWGEHASELRQSLVSEPDTDKRFALLEKFLAERLKKNVSAFDLIAQAVTELTRTAGMLSVAELSNTLRVSHKHLTQQFTRVVGIRPKQFARMLRFSSVVAALDVSKPVDWIAVAHDAKFYDQSHFINEFRAFTGLTPVDYLRIWQALRDTPIAYDPRFVPIG